MTNSSMIEEDKNSAAIRVHDEKMRRNRRKLIQSRPRSTLQQVHLDGARLLPSRYELLDRLPQHGKVCEMGVANGDFSAEIMARCQPTTLHLVDAWEAQRYCTDRTKVEERFRSQLEQGRIKIHVGYSIDRLLEFPDHYFDWVYIDTVHDYEVTAKELTISLKKVKVGGIIAGHDYTSGNIVTPVCYGVVPAVHEFCVKHHWRFLYLTCEIHCYASFALQAI